MKLRVPRRWVCCLFVFVLGMGGDEALARRPNPVILGGDYRYQPYEFLDKAGRPTGYNIDLAWAIADVMGLDVQIRLGPWSSIRRKLAAGHLHALPGMFQSPEREEQFDFSTPHIIIHHSAFARKGTPPIRSLEDLSGRSLVVQKGDILHDFLVEKGVSGRLTAVETQAQALKELAAGRFEYALTAKLPGVYWIRELELEGIRPVGPPFLPSRYCFAFPKGRYPELVSAVNEGLAILNQTGRYAEIYEKWLGPLQDRNTGLSRSLFPWILGTLGGLGLLLAGAFYWNWTIRRSVNRQTVRLRKEIEERKTAEQALHRWGQIFEHAQWGIAVGSADGERFEMLNSHYAHLHGYTVAELLERPISAVRPRDGKAQLKEQIRIAHERGHYRYQTDHCRKDGTLFPVEVDVTAVRNTDGQVAYRVVHLQDISERLAAEAALRESRNRFRMLAESIDEVFWLTARGKTEKFIYVSPAYERVWGRLPAEIYENPGAWMEALHPEDRERVLEKFRAFFAGRETLSVEYRIVHPNGGIRWIWDRGFDAGMDADGVSCFAGLAQDITERKADERERDRLHRMLQTIRACDQILVTARSEAEMLRSVCRILVEVGGFVIAWVGFSRSDDDPTLLPVASWGDENGILDRILHASPDVGEGAGPVRKALQSGRTVLVSDVAEGAVPSSWQPLAAERGVHSAIVLPLFLNGTVIGAVHVCGGQPHAFDAAEQTMLEEMADDLAFAIGVLREREAHRQAEIRLRESEGRLKAVLEAVQVGIILVNAETHEVVDANPAALRLLRRPLEDVRGQVCHQLLCPTDEGNCPITDLHQEVDNSERELLTADGGSLSILKTVVRVQLEGQEHLLESFIDISERKAAEAEREKLIDELQKALSEIRTLRGFLPICASCKKIRDDEGYWHQIESYIQRRADVDFTHSICPDCQDRLYGDLFDDE